MKCTNLFQESWAQEMLEGDAGIRVSEYTIFGLGARVCFHYSNIATDIL